MPAALDLNRCPCAHAGNSGKTITGHRCDCGGAGAHSVEYPCDDGALDDIRFDDTDGAYLVAEPETVGDDLTTERRPADRSVTSFEKRAKVAGATPAPMPALTRADSAGWAVLPALSQVLPDGLRRGSTVAVTSSVSLLLALLGAPSAAGAWVAMIGMPTIGADAIAEAGIDLARLAIINPTEGARWTGPTWTTAVGALLDAVDVVVARPGVTGSAAHHASTVSDPDARRLTARARSKGAVLMLFGQQAAAWPSLQAQLSARHGQWSGIGDGHGRITARQLIVSATGRGLSARPRTTQLWLPADISAAAGAATDIETSTLSQAG